MAAPSMVSRDGENTLVQSVDAVFGESDDDGEENDFQLDGDGDAPGGGSGGDESNADLPQCKVKRNYTCLKCDYYTQNPRFYLYHLKQDHREKICIFECPHCLYASKHRQKLRRHIHMVHVLGAKRKLMAKKPKSRKTPPRPEPLPPTISPPALPPLPDHLKLSDDEFNEDEENMEDEEHLPEEKESPPVFGADGEQVYKCSVCEMMSKNPLFIEKHERMVHLKRKYFRCTKCNYITHLRARYTKHVKYHSMPMIKCEMCDFKTPYKWNLDRHNKNHFWDGPYKCSVCSFAADIKQSLTVHEMNHHVPPVGQLASAGNRRRLKVGATDSIGMFSELDDPYDPEMDLQRFDREGSIDQMEQNPGDFLQTQLEEPPSPPPQPKVPPLKIAMSQQNQQPFLPSRPPLFDKAPSSAGFIQLQKYKCNVCDFLGNLGEVQRHELAAHSGSPPKEAGWKPPTGKRPIPNLIPIQGQSVLKPPSERKLDGDSSESRLASPNSKSSSPTPSSVDPQEAFKKKNASFFEKLKEKLMTSSAERDLTCGICGFEAKCLSEHLLHHKSHSENFPADFSSTRCQFCRQRCKSSSDLLNHLKSCPAAHQPLEPLTQIKTESMDSDENNKEQQEIHENHGAHPMENKVFVWNNFGQANRDPKPDLPFEMNYYQPRLDERKPPPSYPQAQQIHPPPLPFPPIPKETHKKVFKCPHCSFWASTASRFHVHIVGHLNKRPFQCSLCQYSSNWRWDITKHIRLKMTRDPTHVKARVLLTDEAGRRNYSKYNKFLTPIPIEEFQKAQMLRKAGGAPLSKDTPDPTEPGSSSSSSQVKRPAEESAKDEDEAPKKRPFPENKKTMWKCKKCLFRNSDRAVVLAHVKDHYRAMGVMVVPSKPPGPSSSTNPSQNDEDSPTKKDESIKEEPDERSSEEDLPNPPSDEEEDTPCPEFMCETCPFTCESLEKLEEHSERHFVSQASNIKCQFCPFYAESSQQLVLHLDLHLDQNPDGSDDSKRHDVYSCSWCPYVGANRNQLVYHLKWHQKDYPHKCIKCDYSTHTNIILSLHVRLHGRGLSSGESTSEPTRLPAPSEKTLDQLSPDQILLADICGIDTSGFPEIPMVWVAKPMGISKMFKCRFCPHVHMRKAIIQDHEKLHKNYDLLFAEGTLRKCQRCTFVSTNPSVFDAHEKVHLSFCGQVCGIVDYKKTDEEQIEDMRRKLVNYKKSIKYKGEEETSPSDGSIISSPLNDSDSKEGMTLHFCSICPARFLFLKEITIHLRFHDLNLPFKCESCSYTARQRQHLMAHMKVHTDEYKERTTALCNLYPTDANYPRPKVAVVLGEPKDASWNWKNESVWVVVDDAKMSEDATQSCMDKVSELKAKILFGDSKFNNSDDSKENENIDKKKKLTCDKCPAEFFKELALSYHVSLHGGPGPYKCKHCDYAVKTQGNLQRHEAIHEEGSHNKLKSTLSSSDPPNEVPKSSSKRPLTEDPEFGSLIHGNPDFIYPTYIKKGKVQNKRYKCHKCPSAFERREHYKVHLSLHGSKQRYSCTKCDYSVKYFANYTQHLKRHNMNDSLKKNHDSEEPVAMERDDQLPEPPPPTRSAKTMTTSVADHQATMIMQNRAQQIPKEKPVNLPVHRCPHCPYFTTSKHGVSPGHLRCHEKTIGKGECPHCSYLNKQFLYDHLKYHYQPQKYFMKPEVILKCNQLEIWSEPLDPNQNVDKSLIFKEIEGKERKFLPKLENEEEFDKIKGRVYINLRTGEEEVEMDDDEETELRNGKLEEEGGDEEDEEPHHQENGYEFDSNPESPP